MFGRTLEGKVSMNSSTVRERTLERLHWLSGHACKRTRIHRFLNVILVAVIILTSAACSAPLPAAGGAGDASAAVAPAQPGEAQAAVNTMAEAAAPAPEPTPTLDTTLPLSRTLNILVLGSDRRPDTPNWRTDVMMIVALDMDNNRAGVISVPRDIYLEKIPNHNPNKINVVDYLGEKDEPDGGGPKLLSSLIMEKMNIPIHHYVRFDFQGFVDLVNALGGVEVDVDCPYYDYFQIENVILNVKPGLQRLTGEEALVYVRSRRHGGDLDRARRQQRFIWATRTQVLNENILPKLPALYNALSDSVQTDIGVVQAVRIVRFALGLEKENIHGFVIGYPYVKEGYAGNMWVFLADWEVIREQVQLVFDREPFIDTNTLTECP